MIGFSTKSLYGCLVSSELMSIAKKLPPNEKAKRKTHTPPKAMKLPDEEALLLIRDVHSKNLDIKQAAVKYGVSVTTAYNLMNGVNRGYLLRSVEENKPVYFYKKTRS